MYKNRFLSLALLAVAICVGSSAVMATGQDGPFDGGHGPEDHGPGGPPGGPGAPGGLDGPHGPGHFGGHGPGDELGALRHLDLTDAQKASIKEIFKNSFGQDKSQFEALGKQHKAFEDLKPTDANYQAAADSLAQAEASATKARVLKEASIRAQIYAVLTPAQQAKLAAIKANAEARRQQWDAFRKAHPISDDAQEAQ